LCVQDFETSQDTERSQLLRQLVESTVQILECEIITKECCFAVGLLLASFVVGKQYPRNTSNSLDCSSARHKGQQEKIAEEILCNLFSEFPVKVGIAVPVMDLVVPSSRFVKKFPGFPSLSKLLVYRGLLITVTNAVLVWPINKNPV
jgi:hypothetical protein